MKRPVRGALRFFASCATVFWLAGCALPTERIILLPEQEGRASAVVVKKDGREVLLDRPYAATELSFADPWSYRASSAEVA